MRTIVSVATGSYDEGGRRLEESAKKFNEQILVWYELPEDWPPHPEIPYGFKAFALRQAVNLGYKFIMWCDASVIINGNLDGIWTYLRKTQPVWLQKNRDNLGRYSSDQCLALFGMTRKEALSINHCASGCAFAINVEDAKGKEFLFKLVEYSIDGISLVGNYSNRKKTVAESDQVVGHRHDQVVMTLLAHDMKLNLSSGLLGAKDTLLLLDKDFVHSEENQRWKKNVTFSFNNI